MTRRTKMRTRKTARRTTPANPRRPTRAARILRIAAAVLVAVMLLAGAAASWTIHRILVTGKLREWINVQPEKLRLDYASATGWFPWDIHVRGLEMRSRDANVEWWFHMDDVRLAFDPFALLGRRFHVTRVRGNGLDFRLRVRADQKATSQAHFEALPSIPGFEKRPLKSDVSAGPAAPRTARPFRVQIDGLRVEGLREIWIDIWRLHSDRETGALTGSFDLHPHHSVQVGPARVELGQAALALGPHLIASPVSFETDAVIARFDPDAVRGNAVWPFITGKLRLDGSLSGLDFLNYFFGSVPEPSLSSGAGTVHVALGVERGQGSGATAVDAHRVRARYRKADIVADVAARIRIRGWGFEHNRIDFGGTEVDLKNASVVEAGPDSRAWWGRFSLPAADLSSDRPDAFRANVVLHCRDARPVFTLFQVGLPGWARGILELEGLEAHGAVGLGKDLVEVDALEARGGAFQIHGRYRARDLSKQGAFLLESKLLALGLEIEGGSSKLKLVGARKWFEAAPPRPRAATPKS